MARYYAGWGLFGVLVGRSGGEVTIGHGVEYRLWKEMLMTGKIVPGSRGEVDGVYQQVWSL